MLGQRKIKLYPLLLRLKKKKKVKYFYFIKSKKKKKKSVKCFGFIFWMNKCLVL